jgi:N-acetylglutamate synthase-like GNAT family acetyltransferase
MNIIEYKEDYKKEVINLILYVQNIEFNVGISIDDQPDILDINTNYLKFWIAIDNNSNKVIGCIGLQEKNEIGVMKKFFVYKKYRGTGIGKKLYEKMLEYSKLYGLKNIILDTPSTAISSHKFYIKSGFKEIKKNDLPILYEYPDRNSLLFILNI